MVRILAVIVEVFSFIAIAVAAFLLWRTVDRDFEVNRTWLDDRVGKMEKSIIIELSRRRT